MPLSHLSFNLNPPLFVVPFPLNSLRPVNLIKYPFRSSDCQKFISFLSEEGQAVIPIAFGNWHTHHPKPRTASHWSR